MKKHFFLFFVGIVVASVQAQQASYKIKGVEVSNNAQFIPLLMPFQNVTVKESKAYTQHAHILYKELEQKAYERIVKGEPLRLSFCNTDFVILLGQLFKRDDGTGERHMIILNKVKGQHLFFGLLQNLNAE